MRGPQCHTDFVGVGIKYLPSTRRRAVMFKTPGLAFLAPPCEKGLGGYQDISSPAAAFEASRNAAPMAEVVRIDAAALGTAPARQVARRDKAVLSALARATLVRLGLAPREAEALVAATARRFAVALLIHRARFREAGREDDPDIVLDALGHGRFALGRRNDVNLWDDLALAALLGHPSGAGVERFRARFEGMIAAWNARYAQGEEVTLEDFVADLLLPREKTPARIRKYRGRGPLDGWLQQVFISICHKRRGKGLVERRPRARGDGRRPPLAAAPGDDVAEPWDHIADPTDPPDERYARYECAAKLLPVFRECVERAPQDQRMVLLMAVVDDVPQTKLAQLMGVRDYKIVRLKQAAIRAIRRVINEIARRVARIGDNAVRLCLELLLERFPDR